MNSFGDALSVNRSLVKLNLSCNKFGGKACPRFFSGLQANTQLKELRLSGSSPRELAHIILIILIVIIINLHLLILSGCDFAQSSSLTSDRIHDW